VAQAQRLAIASDIHLSFSSGFNKPECTTLSQKGQNTTVELFKRNGSCLSSFRVVFLNSVAEDSSTFLATEAAENIEKSIDLCMLCGKTRFQHQAGGGRLFEEDSYMGRFYVIVGGICGALGGALTEAWLETRIGPILRKMYVEARIMDLPLMHIRRGALVLALAEGAVAGVIAGVIAGAIGRWTLLLFALAAFVGYQTGVPWLLGVAIGGSIALIVLEVLRRFDR